MRFSTLHEKNREQGIALILAIVFLAILSIIGAVVMQVSTRDLSESAVVLPNQKALYAADRAVEYALNRDIVINLAVSGMEDLANTSDNDYYVQTADGTIVSGVYHKNVIDSTGAGSLISGTVVDKGPRNLPPHLAEAHGSEFGVNLYHVSVKATSGENGAVGPYDKTTHVDASIVRLYKTDDDQIFRTSGGG